VNYQYKRVSRKRTCIICGKPDWCSYTPDDKVSFCARISNGADRVSRNGWGVFYHEQSLFGNSPIPFPSKVPIKKPELAPVEIRDFAYRKLIELAPATNSKEITDGSKGLRARKILDFENYGSLPKNQLKRNEFAKIIRKLLNQEFPDFVRNQKSGLTGVPGFWIDKRGSSRLWIEKDFSESMLLIPYRDPNGLIQACQLRLMGDIGEDLVRYLWLSTPKKNNGLSSGSPLHFGQPFLPDKQQTILITEGALKAATAQIFYPELNIIALAGVSCSHDSVIRYTRYCRMLIAFDSDYHQNRQVVKHLTNLINLRLMDSKIYGYAPDVEILVWSDIFKGIDDALLNNVPIEHKSPTDWLESLNKSVRDETDKILKTRFIR